MAAVGPPWPRAAGPCPPIARQFKTMKYRPEFPDRFGCIEDARSHCQAFFAWYNDQHRRSGIGYMTPHSVHYGLATRMRVLLQTTLDTAFMANPNRFKNRRPQLSPRNNGNPCNGQSLHRGSRGGPARAA
jgi:putative transposase